MRKREWTLYVSQYGQTVGARTVKELKERSGASGHVSRMYVDRGSKVYHVGYVIGSHWFTAYRPHEVEVQS